MNLSACFTALSSVILFTAPMAFMPSNLIAQTSLPNGSLPGSTEIELPPVLLQMMRNTSVFDELELSAEQRQQVREALEPIDGRWWVCRNLPDVERIATVKQLTEEAKETLRGQLPEKSFQRLEQLERQALGTRMFLSPEVADAFGLSSATVQRMKKIAAETNAKSTELSKRQLDGEPAKAIQQELQQVTANERKSIVSLLTPSQKTRIQELTGKPFAFDKIRRQLPQAIELVAKDDQWLQGAPTSLKQLRGKVVVLHFYAFQCINCQRNLPHYEAWYRDFADQGLEVIGIQTPETSAERDASQVASAAKKSDIQYRVLMDRDSANWTRWGTTMWPSVYVIDKEGYLRSWWQGELNWKGNPGEQKMREQIKQLLDEDAE